MDNQSRSLDETAGHGYGSDYYATSEAISQDASAAYEGYTPTYGSAIQVWILNLHCSKCEMVWGIKTLRPGLM
ncbi:hypothetical protein COL922a_010363 [Colletotrichum nupharicola]|nr:hypothetical protein COL922a_010363 [Colletotrichum nupharicola]